MRNNSSCKYRIQKLVIGVQMVDYMCQVKGINLDSFVKMDLIIPFSEELKNSLKEAFLSMNKSAKWREELAKYKVWGFKPSDHTLYNKQKEIMEIMKDQKLRPTYY